MTLVPRNSRREILPVLLLTAFLFAASAAFAQSAPPDEAAIHQRTAGLLQKMTLDQKLDYIGGTGFAVRAVPSLNLPALEMSDGPYGVRSNSGFPSTTYPAGIGLAATWNRDLASRVGAGIGTDARARGIHFMLGPGVNIYRSPRNSRNFEYFGEDPFLSASIAVGYITGMQRTGVSATVKHFLANNSEFLRHDSDSVVDERTLREIYLPAFEAAVKQGHVGAIMDSYNLINGQHATQNAYFNIDIARKEWGFKGVMMSDWVATYDGVAAANGGLDIEMPNGAFMNRKILEPAINSGKVKVATIDEKVAHILDTAQRFDWLDKPQTDSTLSTFSKPNQATALDVAHESIVLLKNDANTLPLNKSAIHSILVLGPDAYPGVPVGGGSAAVRPFQNTGILEGISAAVSPSTTVYYERGLPTMTNLAGATNFVVEPDGKPGVNVETFSNLDLTGPAQSRVSNHINFAGLSFDTMMDDLDAVMALFSSGAKHESSRRVTGYYVAPKDDTYEVILEGPGEGSGNRLSIDGKLLFDNWKIVRAWQPHIALQLAAGPHKLVVEDYQNSPIGGRLRVAIAPVSSLITERAKTLAAKADVVVIAAGYDPSSESEGGDRTFDLPFGQDELIRTAAALNPKTVVTVASGGNVDSNAWLDRVPAWLELFYPGEQGGTALADILFGAVDPSGHLPATFERHIEDNPTNASYYPEGDTRRVVYKEGIFVGYRGYEHNHTQPLYPFGYGLSYTTFKYANLSIAPGASGTAFTASFDVTNTGTRPGSTVAQLYVADTHAPSSAPRPPKELKGFEKVALAPGETKHISIPLGARSFAYYNVAAKHWAITPGEFGILIGQSSADIELKGSLSISASAAKTPID